jgi:hypothetical protein
MATQFNASSSSSFISGELGILELLDSFVQNFPYQVAEAFSDAADFGGSVLSNKASTDPLWGDISDYLTAYYDGDAIVYTAVNGADQIASILEFGTSDMPPRAIMRSTALSMAPQLARSVSENISKVVPSA